MDTVLYTGASLAAPDLGEWMAVKRDGREYIPISIQITAGTATVTVEGRNSPADSPVVLKSSEASEGLLIARFPQMRVNITAATGAAVRVSLDAVATPLV